MRSLSLLLLLLIADAGRADVVELADGSVVNGTVASISDGKLVLDTSFAGSIKIDLSTVTSIATDDDRLVELAGGERVTGRLTPGTAGAQLVESRQRGRLPVPPEELAAIYAPGTDPDRPRWSGTASLGLAGASGNAENQSVQLRAEALRKAPGNRSSLYVQQRSAEQNAVQTENEVLLGGRYERDFSDQSFYFVNGSAEHDEFENLDLRAIASVGYGRRLWDRPESAFAIRVGVGGQRQEFNDGQTTNSALLDLAYDYRRRFGDLVELNHTLSLQPQVDDDPTDNYRAVAEFNADLPVGGAQHWHVRFGLRANYNSAPQENVEELDTTYSVNLLYRY